jgi:hypothetical protein
MNQASLTQPATYDRLIFAAHVCSFQDTSSKSFQYYPHPNHARVSMTDLARAAGNFGSELSYSLADSRLVYHARSPGLHLPAVSTGCLPGSLRAIPRTSLNPFSQPFHNPTFHPMGMEKGGERLSHSH